MAEQEQLNCRHQRIFHSSSSWARPRKRVHAMQAMWVCCAFSLSFIYLFLMILFCRQGQGCAKQDVTFLVVPDFLIHADTLDCLVLFLLLPSSHWSCVLFTIWILLYDTILMATCVWYNLAGLFLYDINLRATTTTSLSTRGVTIPINLVISTTRLFTVYHSSI